MSEDPNVPAVSDDDELLTAEQILNADDVQIEDVATPEWGGKVRIRSLAGYERDQFETEMYSMSKDNKEVSANLDNLRARLVAASAIDKKGRKTFRPDQVKRLGTKNAAALDRCYAVAQRLSGLSDDDVQVLLGNSEPGQSDGSTSA